MKKSAGIFVLMFLLVSLLFAGVVSAAPLDGITSSISNGLDIVYSLFRPIIEMLIGDAGGTEDFIAKLLFFFIIVTVVFSAVDRMSIFGNSTASRWVVSIAVSILATRYIQSEFIKGLILPYSVIGIAITAIIPFVIYAAFVHSFRTSFGRKIAWVFFFIVFMALWATRADEIGPFAGIYFWTGIIALLMIPFDSQIRKIMAKNKLEKIKGVHHNRLAADLNDLQRKCSQRYQELGDRYQSIYDSGLQGAKGFTHDLDKIKEQIANLQIT